MIKTTKFFENVFLHQIKNNKFKINRISVNFIDSFEPKLASQHTVLALMLAKQCSAFPSTQLLGQKLKELYGAEINSKCTKFGDLQIISFSIDVINDKYALQNENLFEQAFNLLCKTIFSPKLNNSQMLLEQDIEIEKQNLIELISSELSDKQKLAQINATKLLFENENYAHPSFGSIAETQQINQAILTKTYNNLLENSQIHILTNNELEPEKLKSILTKHAKNLKPKSLHNLENRQLLLKQNFKIKKQTDFDSILQSKLVMGFATTKPIEPELEPAIKLMTAIFGATPTSKLFSIVREKLSLCYYCAAKLDLNKKLIWALSGTDKKNLETAEKAILEQLNEIKNGNFSDKELERAKQLLICNLQLNSDNLNQTENFCLKKILNQNSTSIESEIELLKNINFNQIVQAANLFQHSITYALVPKT